MNPESGGLSNNLTGINNDIGGRPGPRSNAGESGEIIESIGICTIWINAVEMNGWNGNVVLVGNATSYRLAERCNGNIIGNGLPGYKTKERDMNRTDERKGQHKEKDPAHQGKRSIEIKICYERVFNEYQRYHDTNGNTRDD